MMDAPSAKLLDTIADTQPLSGDSSLHEEVRMRLSDLIDEHFVDGQRFWPESVLAEKLKVSRVTVRRALQDLSDTGRLSRFRAKGTFVRKSGRRSVDGQRSVLPFSNVTVMTPGFDSPFLSVMIDTYAAVCRKFDLTLDVAHTRKADSTAEAMRQLKLSPDFSNSAFVLLGNDPTMTIELGEELEARGRRVIVVDNSVRECLCPFVGTNNDIGMRLALKHLIGIGHRWITLLVTEPETLDAPRARIAAFLSVSRDQKIPEMRVVSTGMKSWEPAYDVAYDHMPEVWGQTPRPTAIMTLSDGGAWAALKWLAFQGAIVPDDVSVIGYDDDPASRFTKPGLTSVAHPRLEIVRRSIEMLIAGSRSHELLSPELIVRGSAAPPKNRKERT